MKRALAGGKPLKERGAPFHLPSAAGSPAGHPRSARDPAPGPSPGADRFLSGGAVAAAGVADSPAVPGRATPGPFSVAGT